jgi:hypothetical protein
MRTWSIPDFEDEVILDMDTEEDYRMIWTFGKRIGELMTMPTNSLP